MPDDEIIDRHQWMEHDFYDDVVRSLQAGSERTLRPSSGARIVWLAQRDRQSAVSESADGALGIAAMTILREQPGPVKPEPLTTDTDDGIPTDGT